MGLSPTIQTVDPGYGGKDRAESLRVGLFEARPRRVENPCDVWRKSQSTYEVGQLRKTHCKGRATSGGALRPGLRDLAYPHKYWGPKAYPFVRMHLREDLLL